MDVALKRSYFYFLLIIISFVCFILMVSRVFLSLYFSHFDQLPRENKYTHLSQLSSKSLYRSDPEFSDRQV